MRDRQIYGLREPLGGLRIPRRARLEEFEGLLLATVEFRLDGLARRRVLRRCFLRARRRRRVGLVVELAVLLLLARPPDERGDADAGGGRDGEGLRGARVSVASRADIIAVLSGRARVGPRAAFERVGGRALSLQTKLTLVAGLGIAGPRTLLCSSDAH